MRSGMSSLTCRAMVCWVELPGCFVHVYSPGKLTGLLIYGSRYSDESLTGHKHPSTGWGGLFSLRHLIARVMRSQGVRLWRTEAPNWCEFRPSEL